MQIKLSFFLEANKYNKMKREKKKTNGKKEKPQNIWFVLRIKLFYEQQEDNISIRILSLL